MPGGFLVSRTHARNEEVTRQSQILTNGALARRHFRGLRLDEARRLRRRADRSISALAATGRTTTRTATRLAAVAAAATAGRQHAGGQDQCRTQGAQIHGLLLSARKSDARRTRAVATWQGCKRPRSRGTAVAGSMRPAANRSTVFRQSGALSLVRRAECTVDNGCGGGEANEWRAGGSRPPLAGNLVSERSSGSPERQGPRNRRRCPSERPAPACRSRRKVSSTGTTTLCNWAGSSRGASRTPHRLPAGPLPPGRDRRGGT
jgi:hypothetical protein